MSIKDFSDSIYFEVEAIIDHKTNSNGGIEYLLKWKDFDDEENSWINEEDTNAPSLIRNYWINKKNIVKRRGRPPKNSANRNRRGRRSSKKNNVDNKKELDLTINQETNDSNDDKSTIVSDDDVSMINSNDSNGINVEIPQWLQPCGKSERTNQYFTPYTHNNWENHATILNVVRETENDSNDIFVHIKWPDGTDSYHISSEIYQKCPLKLIQFYEQHLVTKS
ncbi:chromodomain protein 2 [Rhizophagus clarus]|uniref:Chromodomain protein 2 n=1 Tax=Rhizophagus clarus TaxID=94130 RepID=A0A8H3M6H4_9GLOM|nr:chromodomain protein 2 [Rhizophagus clarus]